MVRSSRRNFTQPGSNRGSGGRDDERRERCAGRDECAVANDYSLYAEVREQSACGAITRPKRYYRLCERRGGAILSIRRVLSSHERLAVDTATRGIGSQRDRRKPRPPENLSRAGQSLNICDDGVAIARVSDGNRNARYCAGKRRRSERQQGKKRRDRPDPSPSPERADDA